MLRERSPGMPGNNLGQIDPGNELHHQKRPVAFREIVADPWQSRMMKLGQQTCFLCKLLSQMIVNR